MRKLVLMVAVMVMAGCASSISNVQKQEYQSFKAKGMNVEEDNPGTAAALGLLPGGGSFYTGHPGLGVINLLTWPISVLWDPISGHNGATTNNYYATKVHVEREKNKELQKLADELELGKISEKDYLLGKQNIRNKYSSY